MEDRVEAIRKRYSVSASLIHKSGKTGKWTGGERYGLVVALGIVLIVLAVFGVVSYW